MLNIPNPAGLGVLGDTTAMDHRNQLLALKVLASPMVAGGAELDEPRWPSRTFCLSS